jgi:hypothetical protein
VWRQSSQGILSRAASRRAELAGIMSRRSSFRRGAPVDREKCMPRHRGCTADVRGRCRAPGSPADEERFGARGHRRDVRSAVAAGTMLLAT